MGQFLHALAGLSVKIKHVFTKPSRGLQGADKYFEGNIETRSVPSVPISNTAPARGSIFNGPALKQPDPKLVSTDRTLLTQKYRNFTGHYDPKTRKLTISKWMNRRSGGKELRVIHSEYILAPITQADLKNYVSLAATGRSQ
ncbi:hypothetical protein J41TS12_37040 [Paenibacillus antibioticophila]|uniref:Uncharacterized protein n=1 Tax=Paenibacillus antibioticophila TaxID=1274374 RepID=A0A919XWD0_9BACL|nr:hypothetical protein [Paenibacillus antibioticophila]GIO38843.1 hypothetical protein J41TS12_37040 [Paenibacillus antibioticophila]